MYFLAIFSEKFRCLVIDTNANGIPVGSFLMVVLVRRVDDTLLSDSG